jgi:hypothetical protein
LLAEIGKQLLAKSKPEGISVNESSSNQTQEDKEAVEDKSRADTSVKAVLQSVPCKGEEAEEFEENWSSNSEEEFVSSQQKSTQRDSINLKLAQNFIFENSGLTQQQILAVIKYQNSKEGELQQNSECFLPPDQPSTSGVCSKEKALQNLTDVSAFSGVQSRTAEASCSKTGIGNAAEAICGRASASKLVEAANPSCSRTGVNNTSEASYNRTGVNSTSEASCSKMGAGSAIEAANPSCSIADKADCSGIAPEARCNIIDVSNSCETSCSRIGVRNLAEATCNRTNINSTCDADIVDKWKIDELNDETVEENIFATRQGVGMTDNIPSSALNPVGNTQRNSSNNIEQLNSDSDNDTDFVEVTDVATLPVHNTAENTLELLIQKDKICEIEDDIFADVFSTQTSKEILVTNNNPQDFASKSLPSSSNIHSGLRATENNTFYKEGNEFKMKNSKVVESIVIQDDCRRKDIEADTDVSKSCGIEPEEKDKKPQVAQVTTTMLSSEELQKLQVQALCYCVFPLLSLFNTTF